jgi:hypothetical protein
MAMRASWTRGALVLLLTVGPGCGLAPEIFVGAHSEPRGASPERDAGTVRGEDASTPEGDAGTGVEDDAGSGTADDGGTAVGADGGTAVGADGGTAVGADGGTAVGADAGTLSCGPMDARAVRTPPCTPRELGVKWNGAACETLIGCECAGADCPQLHPLRSECEQRYAACP